MIGNLTSIELDREEREQLLTLLEQAVKDTMVEEHRTDSPDYRVHIERRERVFRNIVSKLRGT